MKYFQTLNLKHQQQGFTLIEVLVYGLVFGVFLFLVTQVFLTINSASANALAMVNLQQNHTRIFNDFNQTIRNANSVESPGVGGSDVALSLNGGEVVYQANDGVLQKVVTGVGHDLSDQGVAITAIDFENISEATMPAVIKMSMTIQSNYILEGGRRLSETFQTTIGLR
jgi:competence protein ComGC